MGRQIKPVTNLFIHFHNMVPNIRFYRILLSLNTLETIDREMPVL